MLSAFKQLLFGKLSKLRESIQQIGVVVLGSGPISYRYAEFIRERPEFNLLAGYSHNEERANEWSKRFGVPCLCDIQSVSDISGVNLVIIASAPYQHEEHLNVFIDKEISILCEKPLVTNLSLVDEVLNRARRKSVRLGCILQKRLNKTTYLAQKFIRKKINDPVRRVEVKLVYPRPRSYYDMPMKGKKMFSGGGALITQGIHGLDLLVYLFGKVAYVEGEVRNDYYKDIEVEDTAEINLKFINGVEAYFYLTTGLSEVKEKYRLICKKGEVNFNDDIWKGVGFHYKRARPEDVIVEFAKGLLNNNKIIVEGDLVLETHKIIRKVYNH